MKYTEDGRGGEGRPAAAGGSLFVAARANTQTQPHRAERYCLPYINCSCDSETFLSQCCAINKLVGSSGDGDTRGDAARHPLTVHDARRSATAHY